MKHSIILLMLSLVLFSCNSEDINCETDITLTTDNPPDPMGMVCDKGLLLIQTKNNGGQPIFSLDSITKPLTLPLVFETIRQDTQNGEQFNVFNRPSQYDAYDSATETYFIEFPIQQRLYRYDIATASRQELIISGFYSAPIFQNSELYTITLSEFGFPGMVVDYSIDVIDQNSGGLTTLASDSFTRQSKFDWESMSSAQDGSGMVYFVSGTNLIQFDVLANATNYVELTPDFDAVDNFENYIGLELRNNGNLLAIRERDGVNGIGLELVELDINNLSATPTVRYDFMANGIIINSEFYSTTYDPCDDTYYITTLDPAGTQFYEVSVEDGTTQNEILTNYLIGITTKNN